AFAHAELPFERLVQELQPNRDSSRSPLIQVLFNFQSAPVGKIELLGLSWMPFEIDQSASQFDLSVTIDPQLTRKILVAYNTDRSLPEALRAPARACGGQSGPTDWEVPDFKRSRAATTSL